MIGDQLKLEARRLAQQVGRVQRQQPADQRLRRHADDAARRLRQGRRGALHRLGRLRHLGDQRDQPLARRRRHQAAGQPVEQPRAGGLLQRAQAPAHGRLAQTQPPRRRRQAAALGGGMQQAQVFPIHR
jgi:hypothetical protein